MKFLIHTLLVIMLVSCNLDFVDKGPLYISAVKDIHRSKELGIFIKEFKPKSIRINDTLDFDIVSAWLEYNFYTYDIEEMYMKRNNWNEGKNWKLKKDFNPINKGHLSFVVKGDFKKRYRTYNDGWNLVYCRFIETKDTAFSNNFTYFETYGPVSYDSLTTDIELQFEYYVASKDTTKYGNWIEFGKFNLTEK